MRLYASAILLLLLSAAVARGAPSSDKGESPPDEYAQSPPPPDPASVATPAPSPDLAPTPDDHHDSEHQGDRGEHQATSESTPGPEPAAEEGPSPSPDEGERHRRHSRRSPPSPERQEEEHTPSREGHEQGDAPPSPEEDRSQGESSHREHDSDEETKEEAKLRKPASCHKFVEEGLVSGCLHYKVRQGDNLRSIAERLGISTHLLKKINPQLKSNKYHIKEGWLINFPSDFAPAPSPEDEYGLAPNTAPAASSDEESHKSPRGTDKYSERSVSRGDSNLPPEGHVDWSKFKGPPPSVTSVSPGPDEASSPTDEPPSPENSDPSAAPAPGSEDSDTPPPPHGYRFKSFDPHTLLPDFKGVPPGAINASPIPVRGGHHRLDGLGPAPGPGGSGE